MRLENKIISSLLSEKEEYLCQEWIREYQKYAGGRASGSELAKDTRDLARSFNDALRSDADTSDFSLPAWAPLRERLAEVSRARAAQGEPAAVTSAFVLAFKRPLFEALQSSALGGDEKIAAVWAASTLVDDMAQLTLTVYQQTREDIIVRQQEELLELSTPVIKLWEGVLAVPIIGTLDSSRSQLIMENLLQRLVETGSAVAIIDITGVPTVDTLVAQHLIKTITAIRLMGAESIVSGIRPQIAQTIVHLGIDLQGIATKATLADALIDAMRMTGHTITRIKA
ncbi:STAS domain-containing protein [Cupriavidus respiraculi]|uniref:RsbT co-antagonist protein RsbRA n=1 Tax=Cupriavidus respiraculi TaxID=195930 RepID=A0ABM8WE18_9BURK|nr:STAS domain-containing protein [Cupriavidus respiraculi]CAG9165332.1 RsbT co-antagonist protein RsbRA [Cupriavidus respiraculi]